MNEFDSYKSTDGLTSVLTIFFFIFILLAGVAVASDLSQIQLLNKAAAGIAVTENDLIRNDERQGIIGLLQFGLILFIAIIYCVWVYRANWNCHDLGSEGMNCSPGWSVGWYFIPFMNLWKPYQSTVEIWKASDPDRTNDWSSSPVPAYIGLWWGLCIVSGILGQASFRMSIRAEQFDDFVTMSWVTMTGDMLDIPLTVAIIMIVRGIHNRLEKKRCKAILQMQQMQQQQQMKPAEVEDRDTPPPFIIRAA